ncbi:HAD-IA family hydrolase [Uliginosibacterium sp. sgz301328]|uniref:HAD-IA family hydrolase n=1 Tax=Uliginosibacterium sp. sgz301328 TaxID=3243764 RepID=UPI00359E7C3F
MSSLCIIFDNDGTLVDSERLGCQAFAELLPELGEPVDVLVERYRGKRLAHVLDDMGQRIGRTLSVAEFEPAFRARTAELFRTELACMPGVREMLPRLRYPYCLASNGPRIKIEQTLHATGLTNFFGDRIFSAYEVGHWKPDPGLFLHAARAMGFTPDQCLVVEDSPTGLLAAQAAGMTGLFYTNGEPYDGTGIRFDHMDELPGLIDRIAAERDRAQK